MVVELPGMEGSVVSLCHARDTGGSPVAGKTGQGVLKSVAPALELEVAAIGQGSSRRVDPNTRRPPAARPHQREMERTVGVNVESGVSPVHNGHSVVLDPTRIDPAAAHLVDTHRAIAQVVQQLADRSHRLLGRVARDDQDRQRPWVSQIRVRCPHLLQGCVGGHPHPAAPSTAAPRAAVLRIGVDAAALNLFELGSPHADPGVREIGVEVDQPVAAVVICGDG